MKTNKAYAITGVASGIGAELAKQLKTAGHTVVGFDIRETSSNVDVFIPLDLNDHAAIETAANEIDIKLDGLCNNAGLPPRPDLESSILQVNFLGQRKLTQALLPHLNTGASIVNMASRAGHGWQNSVEQIKQLSSIESADQLRQFIQSENINATRAYNLSKEAIILWTFSESEAMSQRGMRINSVSPGGIQTNILSDFAKAFGDVMTRNIERAGRAGKPEEVAAIAAFLLSPTSHWIKGADIPVDGGMGAFGLSDKLDLTQIATLN